MKEFEKRKKLKEIEGKFNLGNTCSSGDCTGLIQVEPITDAELESYYEIYNFGPPDISE